jgi:hypothetical protein
MAFLAKVVQLSLEDFADRRVSSGAEKMFEFNCEEFVAVEVWGIRRDSRYMHN